MTAEEFERRIAACATPRGGESIDLRVAGRTIRFEGLDRDDRDALSARWGRFAAAPEGTPALRVDVRDAGDGPWLPGPERGERYRLLAIAGEAPPPVVSYAFGLGLAGRDSFVLALSRSRLEAPSRSLDNAARVLVARLAASRGGIALHGAGVVRDGRAWVFSGPSRAGKTTAVRLSRPALSLGDDFAVLLRGDAEWLAAAVPFDNEEAVGPERTSQTFPLAGLYRLVQAPEARIERLEGAMAAASLLACAAFPWAIPDLAGGLAAAAADLVREGRFAHLHFREAPDFWRLLEADARPA